MCLASRADNSTQDASDLFSSTVHFLLHISRISYFSFFHFLQYNQHVIFFWREVYQSYNLPEL